MTLFASKITAFAVGAALVAGASAASAKTVQTRDSHRIHIGGKILTITEGDHYQGAKPAKITFAGKQVGDFKHLRVRVYGKYEVGDRKVVVLHVWTGGISCNAHFQVLYVTKGKLQMSKLLGKCHTGFVDQDDDKLYFRFKTYTGGKDKVDTRFVFENGRLTRIG